MAEPAAQVEMLPGAEPALDEKDLATINRFASWVNGDPTSITRRVIAAGVELVLERAGHKFYRIADLFRAFVKENEFQRRARVQADEIELRNRKNRGELIPRQDVEQGIASLLKVVAETLDALPDIIERDAGATPAQLSRIEKTLDASRNELHARLHELKTQSKPAAADEGAAPADATRPEQPKEARPAAASGGAVDAAGAFLREQLAGGPKLANEVIAAAAAHQVSETSLRRAKAKLGIVARRAGKGWEWALADQGAQGGQDGQGRQP